MDVLVTILAFLLIIGVLVFVHELGHFWVARRNGIKVEEFAFGLPLLPRIWSKKRGETTYSIYPVPIGGFVRMLGEDGGKRAARSKRSFASKSPGVRARVLVAGVAMNALLAFVLLTGGFLFNMAPFAMCVSDIPGASFKNDVTVAGLSPSGPAADAGVRRGDSIRSVDGERVVCSTDVTRIVSERSEGPVGFVVSRDGADRSLAITPAADGALEGKVGIVPKDNYQDISYPWWEAPYVALLETVAVLAMILTILVSIFTTIFTQGTVPAGVAGPVGIAKLTGQILSLGPTVFIHFVVQISLSLAIFNLLPIPALDGGRLLFVGIEKLRRGKTIPPHVEQYIHLAGFAFLIGLILFITYFDIIR